MELRRIFPLHLTPLSLPPLSLPPLLLVLSLLTSLTSLVSAQSGQGVLIDGNSRLPTCAQQCTLLQQAAQACTAATGPSTQAGWICFCQSAYLKTLRSTAVGICDAACTDPSDNAQVSVWYNGNCGNDNGASEHAEDGLNSQPSSGGSSNNNNGPTTGSGSTNTNTGDGNSNSNVNGPPQNSSGSDDDVKSDQTWWAGHYQWIIMILVLIIAFALFTWGLIFLKKRLDRKRDAMTGGFNAGITTRKVDTEKGVAPQTSGSTLHPSSASGRNSPARTREAFMPYGYGYSGSESRNGSKNEVIPLEEKKSPLARTTTMATEESRDDTEKSEVDGMGPWPVPGKSERRTPGNGKPGVVM